MIQTNFVSTARVAVISQNRILDLSLPTNIPIREVILSIEPLLIVDLKNDQYIRAQLTLGKLGQSPFNPDATLDAVNVVDGDLLIFQSRIDPEDSLPSVVEDIAQISTLLAPVPSYRLFREQFNRVVAIQFLATLTSLSVVFSLIRYETSGSNLLERLLSAAGIVISLILLIIAFILNRHPKNSKFASLYSFCGAIALFISMLWIQNDELTKESLFCALVVMYAWAWMGIFKFKYYRQLWAAIFAICGIATVISAIFCIWNITPGIIGCFLFLTAIGYQLYASTLGMFFARLPLPHVPNVGEKSIDIFSKSALSDMQFQLIEAREYQNGIIASSILLQGVSAMCFISRNWISWLVIGFGVLATVLRSRVWAERRDKNWFISAILIVPMAVIVEGLWEKDIYQVIIVSAILCVISLVYVAVCLNPVLTEIETYPLPLRHIMSLLSYVLDVVLVVGAVYLTGLFSQVLHQ